MARTYRENSSRWLRHPKTGSFRKHLNKYVTDEMKKEYPFSGINRARALKPPTSWDDKKVSAKKEQDYKKRC